VTSEPLRRVPWQPIAPLVPGAGIPTNGSLAALDALREEWDRRLQALSAAEQVAVRQRTLRKLSVETGILERLYDVDWGLTLTLVAEGFTRDVVERAGGQMDERTLATLRAQMDSLGMVLDFVRAQRPLGTGFIRELHHAITRTQETYVVTDAFGRVTDAPLPKGEWKTQPNHVIRQDNTLLEYAPPEQVASEVDRLVAMWSALDGDRNVHPIAKAAWLHHRFVQIHPFADGNGRVARALTLLVLEKYRYAPLVVDRWHRAAYLKALDAANEGQLADLVQLFVKLESAALTSELERPAEEAAAGMAVEVAHTLAAQLAEARRRRESEIQRQLQARAVAVGGRLSGWFGRKRDELIAVFRAQGLLDVGVLCDVEMQPSDRTHWFRHQVTKSAHTAGHYADFRIFAGWASLRIRIERLQLRYVASLHGAGREPGVMAVTTFAELEPFPADEGGAPAREYVHTTSDAFHFVHTEAIEEINQRAGELEQLLDEGLAVALASVLKRG
jgi:fido (protein-threonine AMPylation protein)